MIPGSSILRPAPGRAVKRPEIKTMNTEERIKTLYKIGSKLGYVELYTALAEEASELTKASLKVLRASGAVKNPTPISYDKAYDNLMEEVADVFVCLLAVGILDADKIEGTDFSDIVDEKIQRWANRVLEASNE